MLLKKENAGEKALKLVDNYINILTPLINELNIVRNSKNCNLPKQTSSFVQQN